MKTLAIRLQRMEARLVPSGLIVMTMNGGEKREDCIRRHGYLGARGLSFVCLDDADMRA